MTGKVHQREQRQAALASAERARAALGSDAPFATRILPAAPFRPAEDYHQNYYQNNKKQPYCQLVIQPKIEKFEKIFSEKLKKHL